ncbi:MAG: fibronectin type III domain-containing protein [Emticicia sp.]
MFKVHLLLKDLTKISVDVYLKIRLSGVGVDIRTVDGFIPSQTLTLISGEPRMLTASDLAEYFNISNLVVDGVDISALYNGGRLPEGLYTWTVEAYEIDRNRQVSNTGMALMNVFKNYPPIINIPQDGAILPVTTPQNVLFSWTSRSTASLNAAQGKTYKLRIYPLNGDDDPNVVANSGIQPIEITTTNPFFSYGAGNIPLEKGKRYAVQVQESDDASADDYENEGKSQVVTFSYGKPCVAPEGMVINPIGKGRVELTCEASAEDTESYPVTAWYKTQTPKTLIWNSVPFNGNSVVISGLKDKTPYEFKLSSACGDNTNTMAALGEGDIPSGDPSTEPETFKIDDSEFDEEEPEVLDPAILDPYTIGIEINADGMTRPVETLDGIFNKIIKPECVTNADAYAECSPNHPPAPNLTDTGVLSSIAVGDVLGIYDYAVLITEVGGGTDLSGKGLVKLPFLENSYMAVEFSGIKAKKEEMRMQGGCVYEVGDYFRTRPISQADLQNEQVRTIAEIIKLTEPTVFHGDLEVAIKKYQEKGSEIASKGTATPQERQDLLTYTKGVEVAIGTWKDKFSEVFGSGETDPKIAEILGDMTAILTQLNADKQTIEGGTPPAGTSYPTIPDLKAKIDTIIEKIKALQQENMPKPPKIRNLLAEKITDHSANIKWIGDERFTKYVITYQKIGEGEQIQIINGTNLNLINLESNSQYQIKVEGYIGEQLGYTHPIHLLNTLTNTIPKPENLQYEVIDDKSVKLTWDKNKLHKGYKLIYKDKSGLEKFVPIGSENSITLKDLDPTQLYDYSIVAFNGKTESESALGNFSTELICDLKISSSSTRIISGEGVLISAGCTTGTLSWGHGKTDVLITETPTTTTTYIAICEVVRGTEKKTCTNNIEIVVSPVECTAFTINASKTTIDEGESVTLTASGCDGELTWDNGFGTNISITINPLSTNTYSAKCKGATNIICYASKRILLNCNVTFTNISQSIDFSTVLGILTGPNFPFAKVNRTLSAGIQCNNLLSFTWEGNAKLDDRHESYISLKDVKSDITLKGSCKSEAGTCDKELIVKVYDKKCDNRYAHFKRIVYMGKETELYLANCTNVEWDNGMKGSSIRIPTPLKSTMFVADCGGCKEYFTVNPYETLSELKTYIVTDRYKPAQVPYPPTVDLSMDGCVGQVSWFSEPTTKEISTIKTFPRRFDVGGKSVDILSSYITIPTNPTVNTTYTARCTGANGTFIDKSFSLIASSNSCLRFKDNISTIAKGDKINLEILGCIGTLTWKKGTEILGTGASITDVPLLETTYTASCSNPVCSESRKIIVTPCSPSNFQANTAKKSVKIAEQTTLSINGCTGGEVLWKDENGEDMGIGRAIIVAPYKTTTYIATCNVSGCTSNVKIDVPINLPPPILCEELIPSASKNPVPICEQVTVNATGCTNGKIEWNNGIETKTQEVGNTAGVNFTVTTPNTHFIATCKKIGLPSYGASIDVNAKLCFDALATPNKVSPNKNESVVLSSSGCINSGIVSWKNVQTNQVESFVNSTKVINAYTKYDVTCISNGFEPITKTVVVAIKTPTSPTSGGSFYDEGGATACNSMGLYGRDGFKICDNNNCIDGQQAFNITANAQGQTRYSIKIQSAGCEGGQLWTWRDGDGTETTSTNQEFQFFPKKTGWLSLTCNSCTKNITVWVTEPLDCNAYKDESNDKIGIKELPFAFGKSDYLLYNRNSCPSTQGTIWTDKTDDGSGNYKVLAVGEEFKVKQSASATSTAGETSTLQPAKYYAICKVGTAQCEQAFDNPLLIDSGLRVSVTPPAISTPINVAQNSVSDANSACATGATVPLKQAMSGYIANLICEDINLLRGTDGNISAEEVTKFLPKLADALNAIGPYQLPTNTSAIVSAIVNGNIAECDFGNAAELLASTFEGEILISDYKEKTKTSSEVNDKLLQDYLGKKYIIDLPDPDTKTTTKNYKIGNYLVSFYVDVVRNTAGNYIINGKEYKPLVYDGSNGFAGFYDISILPSINKDENGKYLTDDLNAKGGWLLPASQYYEFKPYQPFLENTLAELQPNFLDSFESYWNVLHKCTSTQLRAYDNGIVPECFWKGVGNPNFAQLAGVIDETYRTGVNFGQFGKFVMPLSNIDDLLRDYLLGITCEDELWDNIKKIDKLEDEIRKLDYDSELINFVVDKWKNEQIETLAEDISACEEYIKFKKKVPMYADIVLNWDKWVSGFDALHSNIDKYVETFAKDLGNIGTLNDLQNYAIGKRMFEVGSIFATAGGASPAEVGVNTLKKLPKLPKNIPLQAIEHTATEVKVIAEGQTTSLFTVSKEGVYTSERWFTGTGVTTKLDEVTNVHFMERGSSFKTGTIEFVEDANGEKWLKATTTASRYASYPNIQKLATHVLDEVDNLADDLLSTLEADLAGNNALKTAFEEDVSLLDTWKGVKDGGSLVKDILSKNILKTITKYDKKLGQMVNYPKYNNVALGKDAGGTLKQFGDDVGANVWIVETNNVFTSMYDLPDSWSFERSITSVLNETVGINKGKVLFDIKGVNIQRAIEGNVIYSPYNGLITEFELQLLLRNKNWYENAIFHESGRVLNRTEMVTKKLKYLGN